MSGSCPHRVLHRLFTRLAAVASVGVLLAAHPVYAQDSSADLREEVRQLRELITRQSAEMVAMRRELEAVKTAASPSGLEHQIEPVVPASIADTAQPQADELDRRFPFPSWQRIVHWPI
jgi:hypothetical protein